MNKKTSKYYSTDVDRIKKIASMIKTQKESHGIDYRYDIDKFVDEAFTLTTKTKNYSPERCIKIVNSIEIYYKCNGLTIPENIETLLNDMSLYFTSDAVLLFAESFKKVADILQISPKRVFEGAELYFVDEYNRNKLIFIKDKLTKSNLKSTNKIDIKRFAFNKIVNFLNEDNVSHKYKIKYAPIFQHISKEYSVERYLSSNFEIWRNTLLKDNREFLATHKFASDTQAKIKMEHEMELKRAEEEYNYILENFESLEVKILGYENANIYPTLSYTTASRNRDKYLKKELINILWFSPTQFRDDWSVSKFIANANKAYGTVYYQHRNIVDKD